MEYKSSISIIVSAFNEEKNLKNAIDSIHSSLQLNPHLDYEIIIINDGSADKTEIVAKQIVKQYQKTKLISHEKNLGLGVVVQTGIEVATKEYFILYAGDDEAGVDGIAPLFTMVGKADLLIPYPVNNDIRGVSRALISQTYTLIVGCFSGIWLKYFNGSVIYKLNQIKSAKVKTSGFGYQAKVLVTLISSGVSYIEVPIKLKKCNERKPTSAFRLKNIISVGKTLLEIALIRFRW
jgi:dolichol-phosphate mannosyltransferase